MYLKSVSAHLPHVYTGGRQIVFIKGQVVNILNFAGILISLVTIQFGHYSMKAAITDSK